MPGRLKCSFASREWTDDEVRVALAFLGKPGCACPMSENDLRDFNPCARCEDSGYDCDALDLARRYLEDGV